MHRSAVLVWLAVVLASCAPAHLRGGRERDPVVVLTVWAAGQSVGGSITAISRRENPEFVLYNNGVVIFSVDDRSLPAYWTVRLTADERRDLVASLKLDDVDDAFDRLQSPSGESIMPPRHGCHALHVWRAGKQKTVTFDKAERQALPTSFAMLIDTIGTFRHPRATPWAPEYIDVTLSPSFDHAGTVPWPDELPDFMSLPAARTSFFTHTVYLPASYLSISRDFLSELLTSEAVAVAGGAWRVNYRIVLPAEERWRPPPCTVY